MAKLTVKDIEKEKNRQAARYKWIKDMAEVFDKNIMYKYYEANINDKAYIKELKELGLFEDYAKKWWRGNMFMTMEKGVYNEETFTIDKYIEFKENFELPRMKELRIASVNWVNREMQRKNPAMYEALNEVYGAEWGYAEYLKHTGDSTTTITIPSRVGLLIIHYDPSSGTFEIEGGQY